MDRDDLVAKLWHISNVYWEPEETISTIMATYDRLTADLDRAKRVVEAARENQTAIYRARCLLHEAQRLRNRETPAQVQHIISEVERVLWDAWNAQNTALLGVIDAPGAGGGGG